MYRICTTNYASICENISCWESVRKAASTTPYSRSSQGAVHAPSQLLMPSTLHVQSTIMFLWRKSPCHTGNGPLSQAESWLATSLTLRGNSTIDIMLYLDITSLMLWTPLCSLSRLLILPAEAWVYWPVWRS